MADLYFVVGSPVAHSLSPAMMTAAFEKIGRSAAYGRLEVGSADWPGVSRDLYERGVCGLNVTVPHKESALRIAADATPVARAIGAANTLLRGPSGWSADNTDGPGFLDRLRDSGAMDAVAAGALVLGAGGSARAIVWALREAGCPRIRIAARTSARAHGIARAFPDATVDVEPEGGTAPEGGVVVNCTPLGLGPDDPLPIGRGRLHPAAHVFDLVYPVTGLVRAAGDAGIPAEHGLELLVAQGARSFRAWTGVEAPVAVMREAIVRELDRRGFPRE